MRLQIQIKHADTILLDAHVDTAFDATGIEAGNHLRYCLLEAFPGETPGRDVDQFLVATAAADWGARAFRAGYNQVATIPLADGRPCSLVPYPPDHVRLDPAEPYVVLTATPTVGKERLMRTTKTVMIPA
jgi:hypothetical protein